jgi:hypothetical protein
VFYRHPLHIYRIEAMAAKPDQDAEASAANRKNLWRNAQRAGGLEL